MVDRLAELKMGAAAPSVMYTANPSSEAPEAPSARDLEAGNGEEASSGAPSAPAHMQKFFDDVETVKADLKEIKGACKKIFACNQNMMMATTSDEEAKISNELNRVLAPATKAAKRAEATLKELAAENATLKASPDPQKANELRIRDNLSSTLTRKFGEVVKEYQKHQMEYKDDVKKKVARQVRIVKEDATDAEIDEVMASGGTQQVLQSAILRTAADPVREAFEKAQDKYRDVQRLGQSVAELNQMFVDFALLVEQQGELLDQIEYNVHAAHEFVQGGNKDIEVAIDYQKSIRKKQCCVMITVLIVAVIVMAVLGVFSGGGSRRRLMEASPEAGSSSGLLEVQDRVSSLASSFASSSSPGHWKLVLPTDTATATTADLQLPQAATTTTATEVADVAARSFLRSGERSP